jgi:chromosome segregation ATPase
MNKLADATKQVEVATRDLKREQQEWHTTLASLKRDKLQLTTSNRALESKKATLLGDIETLQTQHAGLLTDIENEDTRLGDLQLKVDELETKRADKATELADLQLEVKNRKATIDTELEAYATERKLAIKDEILTVNEELVADREVLRVIKEETQRTRYELVVLNQAAIQEQEDLKVSKATVDQDLLDKQAELDELQRKIGDEKTTLQKLLYDRDNAMITIAKAKEQHEKFLSYEAKARKILETKDRELVGRSTDIAHESQLLKNKRSFLAEL